MEIVVESSAAKLHRSFCKSNIHACEDHFDKFALGILLNNPHAMFGRSFNLKNFLCNDPIMRDKAGVPESRTIAFHSGLIFQPLEAEMPQTNPPKSRATTNGRHKRNIMKGKIQGRRCPERRRTSWLKNLREWYGVDSTRLFRAAANKIKIIMKIADVLEGHGTSRRYRSRRFRVENPVDRRVEPVLYSGSDLLCDLAIDDTGKFKNFCRVFSSDFELLLNIIGPKIQKQNTNFRLAIPIKERLAVTLRFLATGDSYASLIRPLLLSIG
ncbi:hypothetical protein HUJ04_011357 [Dendroctonus ponderosae]|nr:hypothetical protein HUJ04_011357 [Dendroctonus ponderosae]